MKANSRVAKGSAPCTIKYATTIVTIMGITDNLKKKPNRKPTEQINSPKIANTRDDRLEIPNGSGNVFWSSSKFDHFANQC